MNKEIKKILDIILKDNEIKDFLVDNNIPDDIIKNNLSILLQQKINNDKCKECLGNRNCVMEVEYMQTKLHYHNKRITQVLVPCPHIDYVNNDLLELMFIPEDYQGGEFYNDRFSRVEVYKKISNFKKDPLNNKGLYIHGAFGTGKTFILLETAKQLSKMGYSVIFAYYPDLVRHIKSIIVTSGTEGIVNKLKNIDILILDDIGAENNTSYIRDEILGPILQFRMLGNKATFMTSNIDLEMLRQHLMETKDNVDRLKADRIIERIAFMMDVVELKDQNLRRI